MQKIYLLTGLGVAIVIIAAAAFLVTRDGSVCDVSLAEGSNMILIGIKDETGQSDIMAGQDIAVSPNQAEFTFTNYVIKYANGHEYTVTGTAKVESGELTAYDLTVTGSEFSESKTCRK